MTFADVVLEKRLNYLKEIRKRAKDIIVEDPFLSLKSLMLIKDRKYSGKDGKEIISAFIENARENEYFKNLYKKIKGKPFTWQTLKEIKEIAGITEIHHDTIMSKFLEVTSAIDRIYAPFLEPLKTFPLIYNSSEYPKGFGLEPNCVGACQITAVLYSYENDINDLRFLEVYSSKRRNTLLQKLRDLDKKGDEFSWSNFDTFFYAFKTEDLRNMVMDQVLMIEEFTHGAIKNEKTGEIYDYELERENYNKVIERDIREGLFYSTFSNLLILMDNIGRDKEVTKAFNELYRNYSDSLLVNTLGMQLYLRSDIKKAKEYLEKIKQMFGTIEELPAKYIAFDIVLNLESFYLPSYPPNEKILKSVKSKINYLKERYIIKDALNIISERYLNSDLLVKIDNFINTF